MQHTADKNIHIHKHGETQTRGEVDLSNISKTTNHRWTHFGKIHARLFIINILHIFIKTYRLHVADDIMLTVWGFTGVR